MPKIVILGSCRFEPYEVLAVPNKVPNAWNTEEGYKIAAQKFYPAIEKADLIICFAPDGVGEHTKRDVEYAESLGKKVHMITEFSNGSGSEGGSATVVTDKGSRTVSVRHAKSGESDSRVAVGMSSGKPAQPKTQAEDCCFRKVKVLRGRAKEAADKQGLGPEDLVVLTTKIKKGEPPEYMVEKVEGDAVSFLLKRAVVGGEATSRD